MINQSWTITMQWHKTTRRTLLNMGATPMQLEVVKRNINHQFPIAGVMVRVHYINGTMQWSKRDLRPGEQEQ